MEDGVITHIQQGSCSLPGTRLNIERNLLLPGFIDLHSDAMEKYIEPRVRAVFPIPAAIMEFDKTLPACGVTTMFNCIAYVCDDNRNCILRTNTTADTILAEVHKLTPWLRTRTRVHIRFDILNKEAIPILNKHIEDGLVHILSFMDHTPGQGQYQDVDEYKTRMISDYELPRDIVEADVVIVNPSWPVDHITTTFTDGKVTYAGDFPFKNNQKVKAIAA